MSTIPPSQLPPSPVPSVDVADPPPWRSARLRFVHHREDRVVPGPGRVALPAVLAGVGLALSLPPWGFWILAFPSAGLLWWRLGGLRPRTRLWAGWLSGLGCFIPGLAWARAFTWPGAIVLIAVEALFPAVACLVVPARPVLARALAFPAALTLAEALRQTWPFGGLPIGGVFLGQADGPVLALARLGGPLALTGGVFLGGVAVAAIIEAVLASSRDRRRARTFARTGLAESATISDTIAGHGRLALAGVAAAIVLIGATIIATNAPDGGSSLGTVTAAAVQGGGVRGFRKSQIDPAVVLAAQQAATRRMQQLDGGRAPQLVLWPEDVVSLDTNLDGTAEAGSLSALARSLHTTLVVGITESVSATTFRNEMVAWGPDGSLVDRFEKVHRVPFGEYVPLRGFFAHFADLSSVPLDAIPGTGSGLMSTPAAPLGALISFEVFYADRGRPSVRSGAQLLIVPTNTSSYASSQVPTQEIAAAEIQATEQGRDLLQAAPTGFSAVVTNRGRLVTRTSLGTQQIVFADLSRRSGWTVYVRYGDWPPLVLAGVALLAGWFIAGRRPSASGSDSDTDSDTDRS
ncbi:MAG TPA: apolipoprotein N-acyltransferase [Acidimicrobiales bacterium]|nr:apolipoprotein N-acyltransferase [Acidimicrobiales bacterium]